MWCGVVWCGVVWCGVVWCGVVWCGVVWCGVVVWASGTWIAFLDDDDTLSRFYLQALEEEVRLNQAANVVVFRMKVGRVIKPPPADETLRPKQVGISFAMKRSLFSAGFMFGNSEQEDFALLDQLRAVRQRHPHVARVMVLSPYLTYFVRRTANEANDTLASRRVAAKRVTLT